MEWWSLVGICNERYEEWNVSRPALGKTSKGRLKDFQLRSPLWQ